MQPGWEPKAGDLVVRRPRQAEIAPVQIHVERRTVSARGPASPMLLIYSFMGFVAIGTILLLLPISNVGNDFTPFVQAVFTATSAVTVTGLVVVDTADGWSRFGQVVIMGLFFVGGLGFMTGAAFLLLIVGQRIGLQGQLVIREGVGAGQLGGLVSIVRNIVIVAVAIQITGSVALFLHWFVFGSLWPGISAQEAAYQSIYHGVSAFNNAGFDVLPDVTVGGSSLIGFGTDHLTLGIMLALIILGGLGYFVLRDIAIARRFSRYRLDSKLVVAGSIGLIVIGSGLFLVEGWQDKGTIGDLSVKRKVVEAVFETAGARTAGFTTIDYGEATTGRSFAIEALMFIGGASASTAGGIKISTFMVIMLAIFANIKGRRYVSGFGREIAADIVRRAMVVAAVAVLTLFAFISILARIENDLPFRDVFLETVSAFGTVGLSTGITSELGDGGRIVIASAMFIGRLGPLTLALLMAGSEKSQPYRLAEERVRIG